MKIRFIVVLLFCISSAISAATPASVTVKIDHDTILSSSMVVPSNTTLIVSPGVCIFIDGYLSIRVEGLLLAEGTDLKPILITGKDRPRGSIDKPCWQGFEIRGEKADAVMRNVRIEGAYRNVIWGARPSLDSCIFNGNHTALYCSGKSMPKLTGCQIYGNTYGLVADASTPLLLDNVITGNKVGVHLQLGAQPTLGRNRILANDEDVRTDDFLGGDTKSAATVKYLWELMNQLY